MQKIFFTPGPTQLYPNVAKYIEEALKEEVCSISHRGSKFQQIFHNTTKSLRKLLRIPESYHVFFLSSATEAMERVIENLVAENSYHFVNGAFSERFFTIAQELGKVPEKYEAEWGKGFGNVLPDKITIFQKNIERFAQTPEEIAKEVRATVWHEIAHHFGWSDEELEEKEHLRGS